MRLICPVFVWVMVITCVHGCGRQSEEEKRDECKNNHGNRPQYPYWFGTKEFLCSSKGKREAPSVYRLRIAHRYIKYQDNYFEFVSNSNVYIHEGSYSRGPNECKPETDSNIAGYGVLSVDCLKRCAKNYSKKYGSYNLLTHNCHDFVNEMSNILCTANECPAWCN